VTITRREFLIGTGVVAGASIVGVAGPAFGAGGIDPATQTRNRLVVIFLEGGNDGLNYVVPRGDVPGAPRYSVYKKVRPTIAYAPGRLLPLDSSLSIESQCTMPLAPESPTVSQPSAPGKPAPPAQPRISWLMYVSSSLRGSLPVMIANAGVWIGPTSACPAP